MDFPSFITRWADSGDAERANKDSFLHELCDVLGVERPHPKTGDPERDLAGRARMYDAMCAKIQAETIGSL